jgi:rod shape determining protein RodA
LKEVFGLNLNKKVLRNFDFGLLVNVIFICIIGIVTISSATHAFKDGGTIRFFAQQIIWTVISLGVLVITVVIDYSTFKMYYKVIYLANTLLLALVLATSKINGASSWFGLGTHGIQPSEFMKLSLIIVFARKIEEFEGNINNFKNLSILFAYAAIPLGLILMQPDLGTAMVLVAIIIGMLFMSGLKIRILLGGLAASALGVLAVWFSPVEILSNYQKERILVFINPGADQLGSGYHIYHSKVAIGSGQIFGMGFGNGLQNAGNFLPEAHTDFIFSVLGEEFGFIGTALLVVLYASMLFRCMKIAHIAKDTFGSMVILGIVSMFAFQAFQNIGMTIGLMPITGITLPFVSYGGSSMLTSIIAIGLVLNIGMRRHKINF